MDLSIALDRLIEATKMEIAIITRSKNHPGISLIYVTFIINITCTTVIAITFKANIIVSIISIIISIIINLIITTIDIGILITVVIIVNIINNRNGPSRSSNNIVKVISIIWMIFSNVLEKNEGEMRVLV